MVHEIRNMYFGTILLYISFAIFAISLIIMSVSSFLEILEKNVTA